MKHHVLELVGAVLLCLTVYLAYAARVPISLPLIGMESLAASSPDAWFPDLIAIPMLHIGRPQVTNLCVGLCTREEYQQ